MIERTFSLESKEPTCTKWGNEVTDIPSPRRAREVKEDFLSVAREASRFRVVEHQHISIPEGDEIIYLGCPYSHKDPLVREERWEKVTRATARLSQLGRIIFSPITHSHPLTKFAQLPGDWEFWTRIDQRFLEVSSKMMVLPLPGWQQSTGLNAEMSIAKRLGLPLEFLSINFGDA